MRLDGKDQGCRLFSWLPIAEHPPACGHIMCDACVQIFGEPNSYSDYEYTLPECIVRGNLRVLQVRLKPPTAGPRVLSIDGEGPRGVIPPEDLEILPVTAAMLRSSLYSFMFCSPSRIISLVALGLIVRYLSGTHYTDSQWSVIPPAA